MHACPTAAGRPRKRMTPSCSTGGGLSGQAGTAVGPKRTALWGCFRASLGIAMGFGSPFAVPPAVGADPGGDVAAVEHERAVLMERYIVSATRIGKSPWQYASIPGFEVLSRAPEDVTNWWLGAHQSGLLIENAVLPVDWRPESPVPYTVIIDETDLETVPVGQVHRVPIKYEPPPDALTWGPDSHIEMWIDRFHARDADTFAMDSNLYGVDTNDAVFGTISLERLLRCKSPLPGWLIAGLLGRDCGIFRESFAPVEEKYYEIGHFGETRAIGPGTLWVSTEVTTRIVAQLEKDGWWAPSNFTPRHQLKSRAPDQDPEYERKILERMIGFPSLEGLFAEVPPSGDNRLLWESVAGLFVRWGLMGPGHEDPAMSHAFLELVQRARREPVTEQVFTGCFGFGFGEMRRKLENFLNEILAKPTSVYVAFPSSFPEVRMKEATADQIARILGDWLRMQGDSLHEIDPSMSAEFLGSAGRMLERAYREDNGLPSDVDPSPEGERSAGPSPGAAYGPAVAMKPFVVSATRIHDPGLQAVYGLYEHDVGDDRKAREFLEAAVKAGVARPRAYLVLAEIRYAEAAARPAGSGGRLSAPQAASVIELLQASPKNPPVLEACGLMAETWAHCEAKPAAGDVGRIVEGVALFPRSVGLAYHSAIACARGGYATQASGLIDEGLRFATEKRDRERFERLRSTLATHATPPSE